MTGNSINPSGPRSPYASGQARRWFIVRHVTIAGGRELAFDAAEWRDAIVVVERGSLEVESLHGDRRTFETGAVLCLDRLPLRRARNVGREPVLLFAVSLGRRPAGGTTDR